MENQLRPVNRTIIKPNYFQEHKTNKNYQLKEVSNIYTQKKTKNSTYQH